MPTLENLFMGSDAHLMDEAADIIMVAAATAVFPEHFPLQPRLIAVIKCIIRSLWLIPSFIAQPPTIDFCNCRD